MFFILNNENAVLAADEAFLESVGTTHIFLLAERFRFGDFQLDEENRTCLINGKTRTFTKNAIQTILGGAFIYRIDEEEPQTAPETAEAIRETTPPTPEPHTPSAPDRDILSHENTPNHPETDAAAFSSPDRPETPVSPDRKPSDTAESETTPTPAAPAISETSKSQTSAVRADTLTLSTPDLPETFESQEEELFTILDAESPAEQTEETLLPDWLETPDKAAAPETASPSSIPETTPEPASSEPQQHEEETLLNLLDLEEETPAVADPAPQPEKETEPDLLEIRDEPAAPDAPEPITRKPEQEDEEDLFELLELDLEEETPAVADPAPQPGKETEPDLLEIRDEPAAPDTPEPIARKAKEEDELFGLLEIDEDETPPTSADTTSATPPPVDDRISLEEEAASPLPDTEAPLSLKEEPSAAQPAVSAETYRIGDAPLADYRANARMIGITPDEYLGFLRQFIDESLQYEAGLKSNDLYIFKKNLISIKDASQLLHLPQLSRTLDGLEEATSAERETLIGNFYGMIQHIRRDLDRDAASSSVAAPADAAAQPETQPETPTVPSPESQAPAAASLSLDTVKPIPFNFSTKAASDELGLPESLVREFVADFVQQARENIAVFEEAQHNGDIDTIQKTAHLLKGAASNLRIDPLAETLKALQYNDSPAAVPELFQTFVGQLKTLVQFTEN